MVRSFIAKEPGGERHEGGAEYWGWGERFGLFELTRGRRYRFFMHGRSADWALSYDEIATRALGFPTAISCAVALTPSGRLIPFSIYARSAPRPLGRGRVVRGEDAAHAMEPKLGQGACQAMEDTVALGAAAYTHEAEEVVSVVEWKRLKRVGYIDRRATEGRHGAHGLLSNYWAARSLLRAVPSTITDHMVRSIQTMLAYSAGVVASA